MSTASATHIDNDALCVLIEGPQWGDAAFYGKWLLAAAHVDELWKSMAAADPSFGNRIRDVLNHTQCVNFGLDATILICRLAEKFYTVVIEPTDCHAEAFWMMTQMGFFALTKHRYKMTLPTQLDPETVKQAMLDMANLKEAMWDNFIHDDQYSCINPFALACTPCSTAAALQRLLGHLDEHELRPDESHAVH